jgi:hypothetical protein
MQRDYTPATQTSPLLFFFQNKLFCSHALDSNCILDQTDLIAFSISLIHSLDERTWKRWAFKTKISPALDRTISYQAPAAVIGLTIFRSSAAWAGSLFSEMGITDRAIHPTRGKHRYG